MRHVISIVKMVESIGSTVNIATATELVLSTPTLNNVWREIKPYFKSGIHNAF